MIWFKMTLPPIVSKQYLVCWLNEGNPEESIYQICLWGTNKQWVDTPAKYVEPTHWAYLDFPEQYNTAVQWSK